MTMYYYFTKAIIIIIVSYLYTSTTYITVKCDPRVKLIIFINYISNGYVSVTHRILYVLLSTLAEYYVIPEQIRFYRVDILYVFGYV